MLRIMIAAAMLTGASLQTARAADGYEWFVILQSLPGNAKASAERSRVKLGRECGVLTKTAHTNFIDGLRPRLRIVYVGPYETRRGAARAVANLRYCVPDVYMKQGAFTAEGFPGEMD